MSSTDRQELDGNFVRLQDAVINVRSDARLALHAARQRFRQATLSELTDARTALHQAIDDLDSLPTLDSIEATYHNLRQAHR